MDVFLTIYDICYFAYDLAILWILHLHSVIQLVKVHLQMIRICYESAGGPTVGTGISWDINDMA